MIRLPPPLRFLAAVLGLWTCLRAAVLAPSWWGVAPPPKPPRRVQGSLGPMHVPVEAAFRPAASMPPAPAGPRRSVRKPPPPPRPLIAPVAAAPQVASAARPEPVAAPFQPQSLPGGIVGGDSASLSPLQLASAVRPLSRWSGSAWAYWRRGDGAGLASGGALGGSQAGARAAYRLSPGLALSVRLSAPMRNPSGSEGALGLDWQPARRLPLHLLAERRQALGRDGRSAFGLTLYGGVDDAALGRLRIDAYAQAGIVGARRRDGFADGGLRLSLPAGRLKLGAGLWTAVQPGVARVDVGPQLSLRVGVAGRPVTLAADWRLRVAGNARPGSGPAVTLATGF